MRAPRRRTPVANCRASHTTSRSLMPIRRSWQAGSEIDLTPFKLASIAGLGRPQLTHLQRSSIDRSSDEHAEILYSANRTYRAASSPHFASSQSKSSKIRDVRRFEAEQISDTNPQNGRLSSISQKNSQAVVNVIFSVDRFTLILNNMSIKSPFRERRDGTTSRRRSK